MKKRYTSYAQIDRELEILKIEKELNYNKLVYSLQKAKEEILPSSNSFMSKAFGVYKTILGGSKGSIIRTLIPYIIGWYFNKKRGL